MCVAVLLEAPLIRKQVFIREDQQERLKETAARKGLAEAELIREGLDIVLEREAAVEEDSWKDGYRQAAGIWKDRTDLDELFADARRRRRARSERMFGRADK